MPTSLLASFPIMKKLMESAAWMSFSVSMRVSERRYRLDRRENELIRLLESRKKMKERKERMIVEKDKLG